MDVRFQDGEAQSGMVCSDPDIMGGAPVFRGTRIPVQVVADMLQQGTPAEEILEGYPALSRELVEYAAVYAATHPRPGRSPVQPWRGQKPVARQKGKLPLVR